MVLGFSKILPKGRCSNNQQHPLLEAALQEHWRVLDFPAGSLDDVHLWLILQQLDWHSPRRQKSSTRIMQFSVWPGDLRVVAVAVFFLLVLVFPWCASVVKPKKSFLYFAHFSTASLTARTLERDRNRGKKCALSGSISGAGKSIEIRLRRPPLFQLYMLVAQLNAVVIFCSLHGSAFAVDFAILRSHSWCCQTVPKMRPWKSFSFVFLQSVQFIFEVCCIKVAEAQRFWFQWSFVAYGGRKGN